MDKAGAKFLIVLFDDAHILEGGEGSHYRASKPYRVLALWWGDHLDIHVGWGERNKFPTHTVCKAWEHGGTSREDDVGVQVLTDVDVTPLDRVVGGLMDTRLFHSHDGWLEESLRAAESLISYGEDLTVRKLIALIKRRAPAGGGHLLPEVKSDVGKLLLDVTDNFTLGSGGERVTTLGKKLHEVIRQVTASYM